MTNITPYINRYRTYSNEVELDAYVNLCEEAAGLLAQLTEYVEDHGNVTPDDVGQPHVNRMSVLVERLTALNRYTAGL